MLKRPGYVNEEYLKAAAELLHSFKQRTYDRMQIHKGDSVLDVGCGAGADTIPLKTLVGPYGRVVGVDYDGKMLSRAKVGAEAAGGGEHLFHFCSDALKLPFLSDVFNSCRSERLFQHLLQPELALAEMLRVTKLGGRAWLSWMPTTARGLWIRLTRISSAALLASRRNTMETTVMRGGSCIGCSTKPV